MASLYQYPVKEKTSDQRKVTELKRNGSNCISSYLTLSPIQILVDELVEIQLFMWMVFYKVATNTNAKTNINLEMRWFKSNCSCKWCFLGSRQILARESVSSVFSIEMSHLARISYYTVLLYLGFTLMKVNYTFEIVKIVSWIFCKKWQFLCSHDVTGRASSVCWVWIALAQLWRQQWL